MIKPTIAQALSAKLGRTPTNPELKAEVRRILSEAADERMKERARNGKLPHQRR